MHFLNWASLHQIGNSRIVRMTILVPFLGYFLLFNQNIVQYLNIVLDFRSWSQEIVDHSIAISVSWRIYAVYYGLCFFGLGSLIYWAFCPPLIKRYASEEEYVRDQVEYTTRERLRDIDDYLMNKKNKNANYKNQRKSNIHQMEEELRLIIARNDMGIDAKYRMETETRHRYRLNIMREFYGFQSQDVKLLAIKFTMMIYALGFVFLSAPAIVTFLEVGENLFELVVEMTAGQNQD